MKVLYFDCSSGISGNMTLGALSELIDDPHYLVNELKKLNVDGYHIHISKEKKNGITGTYVDVHLEHEHHHEHEHDYDHEHHHEHDHEEHEHHHDHDCCGHDHHHHHADEVFTSWGKETPKKFTEEGIRAILDTLSKEDSDEYGIILRAKGIVPDENGKWIHFDLVPGEDEVRYGSAEYTGRICVIGSKLNEDKLAELFGL